MPGFAVNQRLASAWHAPDAALIFIKAGRHGGAQTSCMFKPVHLDPAGRLNGLRKFARDRAVPEELAIAVYEREVLRLREGARVEQFVCVIAEKRAKGALKTATV